MNKNIYKKKWDEAKKTILGGNSLISKRPELHLPVYWPTYYKKAKGCFVWDIQGKKYIDMIFAVGQNTLGYANSQIDKKIIDALKKGNMSSLNCVEELELAQRLLKIHKWAGMAKFARSGAEASSIAIRIARSVNNNDSIAVCGYHGWHDWYLSMNLKSKNSLNEHLLPGLNPIGVPKYLKNKVHPFSMNDFNGFKNLYSKYKIGIAIIEIARTSMPNLEFLKNVRKFCNKNKIILIFDECTSAFRVNYGGLHLITNVNPDIATFGKALGNGYAISAIIGKKNIMQKAKGSFISSTFWSERIGFVAANETLKVMKKTRSQKLIKKNGDYLQKKLKQISKIHNVPIIVNDMKGITSFIFKDNHQKLKTFMTQEMLKFGFLASNVTYVSIEHKKIIIDKYIYFLSKVFKKINILQKTNFKNPFLKGPVSASHFKRLSS
ncbi:MAG: hypothetical protein CMG00_07910 [Candidatus Marinimicrobia bacterium]|nr:hypothetical protein [Candidatus Neomarinimicrobiota bacterium]